MELDHIVIIVVIIVVVFLIYKDTEKMDEHMGSQPALAVDIKAVDIKAKSKFDLPIQPNLAVAINNQIDSAIALMDEYSGIKDTYATKYKDNHDNYVKYHKDLLATNIEKININKTKAFQNLAKVNTTVYSNIDNEKYNNDIREAIDSIKVLQSSIENVKSMNSVFNRINKFEGLLLHLKNRSSSTVDKFKLSVSDEFINELVKFKITEEEFTYNRHVLLNYWEKIK